MSHTCKNLLIRCMDFRLNRELERWMKESGIFDDGCDIISLAGASKILADGNEQMRNGFLENAAVSVELHNAEKIIICHHSDCGAYAKSYKFGSPEEEKEKQIEDMKKSRIAVRKKYPAVEIILLWAELKDGAGGRIEFETIK